MFVSVHTLEPTFLNFDTSVLHSSIEQQSPQALISTAVVTKNSRRNKYTRHSWKEVQKIFLEKVPKMSPQTRLPIFMPCETIILY